MAEQISTSAQKQSAEKSQPRFPYNQKTKKLLYIGTKIFHEAIMKNDVNNKTEILTMNGVEIMKEIVSFILENSFSSPKRRVKTTMRQQQEGNQDQMSVIHEKINEESVLLDMSQNPPEVPISPKRDSEYEQYQEINIKAIEAQTLLLSMQATHKLLEEDTQSFIDIRLEQRIEIFTQMTQILNLSFKLYDFIDNRELKKQQPGNQRKNL